MAVTTVAGVALGRQLSLHERLTLQEALNVQTLEGLARFVLTVLKLTLAFELAGAVILTARWAGEYGLARAAYYGIFHAISAFNNAGFALFSDSLRRFRGDWSVNLVVTTLVICGGLGFVVLTEIGRVRRYRRLSTHTRLILTLTAALIVVTTALIWFIERNNPRTLQPLGAGEALLASYFQAVTSRTAGFNTLDVGAMQHASVFLLILLMFIGAAPGVAGLLLLSEGRELLPTLFETTSAFGTVGLSMGEAGAPVSLVGHFSRVGKAPVIAMMFMSRIGHLTLAVAIARRHERARVRHPEGKFLIG